MSDVRQFGPHAQTFTMQADHRPTAQPAKPSRETIDNDADMISIADVLKIINNTANDQPFVRVDQLKQALKKA